MIARRTGIVVVGAALLALPQVATACTVCGAAQDNANTFLASTVVLSLLPLALIFGGAWALYYLSTRPDLYS